MIIYAMLHKNIINPQKIRLLRRLYGIHLVYFLALILGASVGLLRLVYKFKDCVQYKIIVKFGKMYLANFPATPWHYIILP